MQASAQKGRKSWASILVTLEVGNAVKGAETRGPCSDRNRALCASSKAGLASSRMNLSSNFLVAFFCHPTFAHSSGNPCDPTPLPQRTLHDGGQKNQVGGHIGRYEEKRKGQMQASAQKGRKSWASILVTLEVGNAVKGAETRGPCSDRNRALCASSKAGHTSSRMNLSSNFLVAFFCHPTFG